MKQSILEVIREIADNLSEAGLLTEEEYSELVQRNFRGDAMQEKHEFIDLSDFRLSESQEEREETKSSYLEYQNEGDDSTTEEKVERARSELYWLNLLKDLAVSHGDLDRILTYEEKINKVVARLERSL